MPTEDITGLRSGKLTAVRFVDFTLRKKALWLVRCDCGNPRLMREDLFTIGAVKSCGCTNLGNTRHGHRGSEKRKSPTYYSWASMRNRCTNPRDVNFKYYGGIGVTICERWKIFANFLADMGERPPGTSLDRINPWGNYEPGNCRWATPAEQTKNRRGK